MFEDDNRKYYSILGIDKDSDINSIKSAYKKLSFKWHPDKNIYNKEEAEEKFKDISEAYQVLSNPQKKKMYDMGIDPSNLPDFSNFTNNYGNMFGAPPDFVSNIFNFESNNIINNDIELEKQINLEEAYFGTCIKIDFKVNKMCNYCLGNGLQSKIDIRICSVCNGSGKNKNFDVIFPGIVDKFSKKCTNCNGIGKLSEDNILCTYCKGGKTVKDIAKFIFDVPSGVTNNYIFIIKGKGSYSPINQETGELRIKINITKHKEFKRVGNHLLIEKKILLLDALCNSVFNIKHISKKNILYKTKNIITPNSFQVIHNLGMPIIGIKNKFGHLIIRYHVIFPEKLSEKRQIFLKKILPISENQKNIKKGELFNSISLNESQNEKLYEKIYLQKNIKKKNFNPPEMDCVQM